MTDKEEIGGLRISLMGFATIWIMLFHGKGVYPINLIRVLIGIGYLGVEIFMFLSGFSMGKSFVESCGKNIRKFYSRRLWKIIPFFLPFATIGLAYSLYSDYGSFASILEAMNGISFWIGIITYRWFIPCILLCYLITPLISRIFERFKNKRAAMLLMVAACVLIAIPFAVVKSSVMLMIFIRIPEYIIGFYYSVKEPQKPRILLRVLVVIAVFLLYMFPLDKVPYEVMADRGLFWWPGIIVVSSLVICLSGCRFLDNPFCNFCGRYSLEIYLWHTVMLSLCTWFISEKTGIKDRYGLIACIGSAFITFLIVPLYSKAVKICVDKIRKI